MDITSFINIDILPLKSSDNIGEACAIFEETTHSHIPVIDDHIFLGNLAETDCKTFEKHQKVGDFQYLFNIFFVKNNTNWFDTLETFARNKTNIMPVLNETNEYIGFYELSDILTFFNETPFLNEAGNTLIIEKSFKDYSFSEICQIIESNNTKLLGAFISDSNENNIQITLKIAKSGLNEIIQTFRRYNYDIILGSEEDSYLEDLKERSQYLSKYLNI